MLAVALAVALSCLVLTCWGSSSGGRVERFLGGSDSRRKTIFVSVASYRDTECSATIADMFAKASDPSRVFVGTCEQNLTDGSAGAAKESCVGPDFTWAKNVRRTVVSHAEAGGPTVARYFCSLLYRGEDYFFQIDSHTKFVQGWDSSLIRQHSALPTPARGVLTGYPRSWDDDRSHPGVAVICKSKFGKAGVPMFESVIMDVKGKHKPVTCTAGGMLFGPGSLVRDVPYDPDLEGLFLSEELLYSARAWTSGYDFFAPTENVVYHFYTRADAPKFWSGPNAAEMREKQGIAMRKVKQLMAGGLPGYFWGMGDRRTVAQYLAFAGLDWKKQTSTSFDKFCVA